jgi:lysyl-tRNA synthetase, class II
MTHAEAKTSGGIEEIRRVRREKADKLAEAGWPAFPSGLSVTHTTQQVRDADGDPPDDPTEAHPRFRIGGRMMAARRFGKASFISISDGDGDMQVHLRKDILGEELYARTKLLDLGDIIVVEGPRFMTRRGELTVQARDIRLATKSLHPLPDKHAGLVDVEQRYRQRYVDLAINPEVRGRFRKRSEIIAFIRTFLDERDYMEV